MEQQESQQTGGKYIKVEKILCYYYVCLYVTLRPPSLQWILKLLLMTLTLTEYYLSVLFTGIIHVSCRNVDSLFDWSFLFIPQKQGQSSM